MPEKEYAKIKKAVQDAGFFTTFHPDDGGEWIVLMSHCTEGRLHGNSIRASFKRGRWFLFTWAPTFYRLDGDRDIAHVCLDCLRSTQSILGAIPPEIVDCYKLVRVSQAEYDEA